MFPTLYSIIWKNPPYTNKKPPSSLFIETDILTMRSFVISIFLCFLFLLGTAQSELLIGEWKSLLPINTGKHIAYGNGKIFYGSDSGIYVLDEDDIENPQFFTTIDGLSGINVDKLAFDDTRGELIIAYDNSIIDIFSPSDIFTIRDIFSNTSILGSKQINEIFITEDGSFAYFATGFGILQYDLERREFGFNTFTSERVNAISLMGSNLIFASTEAGCYKFDLSSTGNENFFGDWELIDTDSGIGELYNSNLVEVIGESVFVSADDQLYVSTDGGNNFESIYTFDDSEFTAQDIVAYANGTMLVLRQGSGQSQFVFFDENNEQNFIDEFCGDVVNNVIVDGQNRIWMGDEFQTLKYKTGINLSCERLDFNTPYGFSASELVIKDNSLFVATGGVNDNFNFVANKDGFYEYTNNEWVVKNFKTDDKILPTVTSFFAMAVHPSEKLAYAGTYWAGIYEYDYEANEITQIFDKDNTPESGLNEVIGDVERTRIASMVFDDDDNLWIANFGAENPLVVYTPNGNWFNFNLGSNTAISDLVIDDFGYIWMVVNGNGGGVLIYDTGEIIEDPNDGDSYRFIRNTELPSGSAKTLALDVTGDVWVGTTEGAMVFECGPAVLDSETCNANHPKFVQEGIPAFLLETELVQTIMIDGANRKWFGTRNGIFVVNANTDEQIAHFTTENSPLFDNDVLDIAYNEDNGEVYIATAKGIMIYRSDATAAPTRHRADEIYAYPNPVTADYTGPIAIKGLARDANVKITDLNGKLVFETTALGGQAIWDGTHYDRSSKVGAGVYLVFSSTTDVFDEPNTFVTKILVVR